MQKIVYLTNYQGYKAGQIEDVPNNIAHTLVERGVAMIYNTYRRQALAKPPMDKMMKPSSIRTKIVKETT